MKNCEVKDCKGQYEDKILYYIKRRIRNKISIEEYNNLDDKKGYVQVISTHCNFCNDDLDKRLVDFIRSNPLV